MSRALLAIFLTLGLDSIGMGLILPILPALIRETGHLRAIDWHYGALISVYALMQFLCAPVLGALSDRFGRRPVLLVSVAGAMVDYLFMALAPSLGWLFLGRAIAGITGANMAVATALIADVTSEEDRAKRFGQMGALFASGFILGPLAGGLLGEISTRAPFVAAAGLNALNLALIAAFVPETRPETAREATPFAFSFLGPIKPLLEFRPLWGLFAATVVFAFVGEVAGTIWVPFAEARFGWSGPVLGLSLTAFGLFHAATQAFVVGPLVAWKGQRAGLIVAMLADGAGYVAMALIGRGWMAFALMPLFALGGAANPILQALLSEAAGEGDQGRLMGTVTSLTSFVSIFAPMAITLTYAASATTLPGLVWILAAACYPLCLPFLRR
jgi:DHA1 family tetracycline resistance protein-like MFS transporter